MKTNNNIIEEEEVTPIFFNITNEKEELDMQKLLCENPHIKIFDAIQSQLKELVRSLYPNKYPNKKYTAEQIQQGIQEHIKDIPMHKYGVWVYYPWSSRLVHILEEKEFIDLRTNRNMYKITKDERNILATKKIGIIGLSVGQSIALTLAMERGCGELRLADFDVLELSNLNRIRSGIHNIGLKKVIMAAREIAEIDPYLKVICFEDGVTEANMDKFFLEGGKLDILVDECDGLDIKILSRQRARQLGIPVVMDTSDRGLFDVERFDIEPDRPILHGLIENIDPKKIKELSDEEKIPYILPMIGSEKLSIRMKASMVEVDQSITTWPQLASAVVLGGALGADVCRRILLNQFHESGRYYVDIEDQIGDKDKKGFSVNYINENPYQPLQFENLKELVNQYNISSQHANRIELNEDQINILTHAAHIAPSAGNSQPWKWLIKQNIFFLFHDKFRSYSWGDYNEIGSHLSLGSAIENIYLKALMLGLTANVQIFPEKTNPYFIAIISFNTSNNPPNDDKLFLLDLAKNIELRCTNRKLGKRERLEPSFYEGFKSAINSIEGADLQIIETDQKLLELGEIISVCDRIRLLHEKGHEEFYHEMRWNKEEVQKTRDGLDINLIDLTPSELSGLNICKDWNVMNLVANWNGGRALQKMSIKSVAAASCMILVTMPMFNHLHFIQAGRAIQRGWIYSNTHNVSVHPMLSPVFFFNRLIHGKGVEIPEQYKRELIEIREKYKNIFKLDDSLAEVFLLKLAIAEPMPGKTLRLPSEKIFYTIK